MTTKQPTNARMPFVSRAEPVGAEVLRRKIIECIVEDAKAGDLPNLSGVKSSLDLQIENIEYVGVFPYEITGKGGEKFVLRNAVYRVTANDQTIFVASGKVRHDTKTVLEKRLSYDHGIEEPKIASDAHAYTMAALMEHLEQVNGGYASQFADRLGLPRHLRHYQY